MCKNTVQKPALSTAAFRLQRKPSLLNFGVDISEDLDFDVARGKANVLPEYYRKQGSGEDEGYRTSVFR